jgi:hypothetical protein
MVFSNADATILRQAVLGTVHAGQDLDTPHHGRQQGTAAHRIGQQRIDQPHDRGLAGQRVEFVRIIMAGITPNNGAMDAFLRGDHGHYTALRYSLADFFLTAQRRCLGGRVAALQAQRYRPMDAVTRTLLQGACAVTWPKLLPGSPS